MTTRTLRTLPPDQTVPPTSVATPPAPAAPVPTTPGPGGPSPAPTAPAGGPSSQFCAQVRRYTDSVNQLNASPSSTQLHQLVVDVTASIEAAAAAASAPAAVSSDVTLMAGAHRRFLTALQQADFDPAALAPGAGAELQSAAYLAAKTRVRDFNRGNC